MKKIYAILVLMCGLFISMNTASANSYVLDNASVDNLFAVATEIDLSAAISETNGLDFGGTQAAFNSDKNAIVAALLAFFLGGWAIHRYYLGTKSMMFFYYFCTCGGIFGVLPLIDFIMLLVDNKDISKYCNNENFIMW